MHEVDDHVPAREGVVERRLDRRVGDDPASVVGAPGRGRRETATTSCSSASAGSSADPITPEAPNTATFMHASEPSG